MGNNNSGSSANKESNKSKDSQLHPPGGRIVYENAAADKGASDKNVVTPLQKAPSRLGLPVFGKKQKELPPPLPPLITAEEILNSFEARERVISAMKVTPPGTAQRWSHALQIINRFTEPTEEEPLPLQVDIPEIELKKVLLALYSEVKYISSEGLALAREIIPGLYDKHTVERASKMSRMEREKKDLISDNYAYGEVDYDIFATMYLKIISVYGERTGGIFVDLGSGAGKLVRSCNK